MHFQITVCDDNITWTRDAAGIAAEAQLDGIYIVRTSLPVDTTCSDDAVYAYESSARIERALRSVKMTQLKVRPDFVCTADHEFLCMLADYLE